MDGQFFKNLALLKNKPQIGDYIDAFGVYDCETSQIPGTDDSTVISWAFCLCGAVTTGRTSEDFYQTCEIVKNMLNLNENRRLVIYVHNLSFDFQFFRKWFNITETLTISRRTPITATTDNGFEFRCSNKLSNLSLANLGKENPTGRQKLVGDFDYEKIRTSKTPLTDIEWDYQYNDVYVVYDYVKKLLQTDNISNIPVTSTGFVRRECRRRLTKVRGYRKLINSLTIGVDEYKLLVSAFMGGFTHASHNHVGKTVENVTCYDITSAYPAAMLMSKVPMSTGQFVGSVDIETVKNDNDNLYVFDFECDAIEAQPNVPDHILSLSKCVECEDAEIDNGRVVECGRCKFSCTSVDLTSLFSYYYIENPVITNAYRYKAGYLPDAFRDIIAEFFNNKTTLKGVSDKKDLYNKAKAMLNSMYGMIVTAIIRDEYGYVNNEWQAGKTWVNMDIADMINDYNESKNRFLFYPWGIFITANVRRIIHSMILLLGNDYIYSDTDSLYVTGEHTELFDRFNKAWIDNGRKLLKSVLFDKIHCKAPNGDVQFPGVFTVDGHYIRYKTLGAKRYLKEKLCPNGNDCEYSFTVSGWKWSKSRDWLDSECKRRNCDIFDLFNDGLTIPPEYSGRLAHKYNDEPSSHTYIGYDGSEYTSYEKSSVSLVKSPFSITVSKDYKSYLESLENGLFFATP